jgi:hypothetical protein
MGYWYTFIFVVKRRGTVVIRLHPIQQSKTGLFRSFIGASASAMPLERGAGFWRAVGIGHLADAPTALNGELIYPSFLTKQAPF